jgi:hypothetical protein
VSSDASEVYGVRTGFAIDPYNRSLSASTALARGKRSPSDASLDRVQKLGIYAREQVAHAWLIDPLARTLEVLRQENGRWSILATHTGADVVRAEPFTELELDLSDLWVD